MKKIRIALLGLVVLFSGSFCYAKPLKAYVGPKLSADNLARVTFSDKMLLKIVLHTIDGEYYSGGNSSYPLAYNNGPKIDINILPGYHELEFDVRADNTSTLCTVKVIKHVFEAGTEYILNVDKGVLTVEEKADKKKVPSNAEIVDLPFYQEPDESGSYATLVEDGKSWILWLMKIDGQPGPVFNMHAFFNDRKHGRFEVRLTPGLHVLTFDFHKSGKFGEDVPIVREFVFEVGKRYEFDSNMQMVECKE